MSKIADYANAVASRTIVMPDMPVAPEECAMFQRILLSHVGLSLYGLTGAYAVAARRGHPAALWATDVEIGAREHGYAISVLQPGCLIFSNTVSLPYGHVACYLGNGKILHNTLYSGGDVIKGCVKVHNISIFGAISTIANFEK